MFDHQKVKPHVVNQLFTEYSQLGYVQHKLNGLLVAMLGYASKSALLSREGRVILEEGGGTKFWIVRMVRITVCYMRGCFGRCF